MGLIAGLGDTMRSADADYKASVAADNSFLSESLGMEYVKSEPHVEVLGRWLNKQPIHVQLMVQAFGVTFGDDYAQVYMIVNKLMTNYNNNVNAAIGDGSTTGPAKRPAPMSAWVLKQQLIAELKRPENKHLRRLSPPEGGAAFDRSREGTRDVTMNVVYNAKPAIENALRSAGWMMSNIVKNIGFSAEASKDYVASYEARGNGLP